uniref:uncharacterized protein LOC120346242 isoform X1 n=1 Tax=Styela clava TaxID=7725 RepID=UPI001939FADE|nr:uncharacterized protein LOC120346242 isoform X1 [Styela clava]
MRGDQAITFLIFLTTGISMSNEEDFICEGKRGWYGIPLTCHHGTSNEKSTQNRLRILTKKLKVAEDDIAKIEKENLELKNKLATLESFVMPLKDESAPNRTDKCDVVTENFCFLTLVEKKWKMSFEDAVTACNKLGCTVANITNEAIYTRITSNLRRKIPNG